MTTTVKIEAHVGTGKKVSVRIVGDNNVIEVFEMADGEKTERHVYDDREIFIREIEK